MTSTRGGDPHPEITEISDLTEDLLTSERAAEVRLHLAECPLCTDVLASLSEISGLLGELAAPEPMPADVADRIDAALAVENTSRGNSPLDVPRGDVPRETSPSAGGSVPRETSSAPAHRTDPSTRPSQASSADRRRRRRRVAVLTGCWVAGALALGGALYGLASVVGGSSTGGDASSAAKQADSARVTGSVADDVRQLLDESYSPAQPGGDATEAPNHSNTPMLHGDGTSSTPVPGQGQGHGVAGTPTCVLQATHRTQAPLAVGRDPYQGTDAYLVVLPHPGDSSLVDAFVVDASCSAGTPGTVLFQSIYPRR
ncbi:hypothetical protein SAMN05216223_105192 [Actinacidiphila yanglinensis]|uniref:Zinc-finger n=1 Tax=Actinacidiphila yanglinensis TaxID=310779 RepID=A0A1H6A6S6_9ACTN|nr:zf-HC2 domain-containing protein [Actinacidiphila yanglinensis]SEG44040.1 hypothetical protein SAMN05216223_105192 [Actinacidiphila yanglinensis]